MIIDLPVVGMPSVPDLGTSEQIVTGRYDVILTVMLNEEFELLDFFKNEMSKVKGVRSTETFVLFRNFSWKIPYVL